MQIKFNLTGKTRKDLVKTMGEILGVKPKYMGMPSANFMVNNFVIDRNGVVEFDEKENIRDLLEKLEKRGFTVAFEESEKVSKPPEKSENTGLTVAVPLDKVNIENLRKLLEIKGNLIKKALGINDLNFDIFEDKISFSWLKNITDTDTTKAYTNFISALCKMSHEQKRINSTEKAVDNEKYAFICFLLRLGFIGAEYKADRKILLKNLNGSSAFKTLKEVENNELSQ